MVVVQTTYSSLDPFEQTVVLMPALWVDNQYVQHITSSLRKFQDSFQFYFALLSADNFGYRRNYQNSCPFMSLGLIYMLYQLLKALLSSNLQLDGIGIRWLRPLPALPQVRGRAWCCLLNPPQPDAQKLDEPGRSLSHVVSFKFQQRPAGAMPRQDQHLGFVFCLCRSVCLSVLPLSFCNSDNHNNPIKTI